MSLLIIHLSDLHFRDPWRLNALATRSKQMAAAVGGEVAAVSHAVVVVTGDVACSGSDREYVHASTFLSSFQAALLARYPNLTTCPIVVAPGNHDCDFEARTAARDQLVGNMDLERYDESVRQICVAVQAGFGAFAERIYQGEVTCEDALKLYHRRDLQVAEHLVAFHVLNSAWMSTLHEKQGQLQYALQELEADGSGVEPDLAVALLHHPMNWFEANNAKGLRVALEGMADIVLTGHEHDEDEYVRTGTRNGAELLYFEGGVLQQVKDRRTSEFRTIEVDLAARTYHSVSYRWAKARYEPRDEGVTRALGRAGRSDAWTRRISGQFQASLDELGLNLTHPDKADLTIRDLYVYPDLEIMPLEGPRGDTPELVRGDDIFQHIVDRSRVLVIGEELSGKTALSKAVFCAPWEHRVPVYLNGRNVHGAATAHVRRAIEAALKEQYDGPDLISYWQMDPSRRAVILDDYQLTCSGAYDRDKVARELSELCDTVVLVGDPSVRMDALVGHIGEDFALWEFEHCRIMPMGHERRASLVRKWYSLSRERLREVAEYSRKVVAAEKLLDTLLSEQYLPAYPMFALVILQQIELSAPLSTSSVGSFGFMYESLLTNALARASGLRFDLSTQYTYLSEFAYALYDRQKPGMTLSEARRWHQDHCTAYSLPLDFARFTDELCKAGVLAAQDGQLAFRYPYMYYYFVARYFGDNLTLPEIRAEVASLSHRLGHTASANIIIFLTYLSRDPFIIGTLIDAAHNLFAEYDECDLVAHTQYLGHLTARLPDLQLDGDPDQHQDELNEHMDALARTTVNEQERYSEDDTVGLDADIAQHLQIGIALRTIQILGQILRGFAGALRKETKVRLLGEAYSLGLRVLRFVYSVVEDHQDDLMEFLAAVLRSRFPSATPAELAEHLSDSALALTHGFAIAIVRRISDSVGHDLLTLTFDQVIEENRSTSRRLIDVSIRMDYVPGFPVDEVRGLARDLRSHAFAMCVLQNLVWSHFYFYRARYDLLSKACNIVGIKVVPALSGRQSQKREQRRRKRR